MLYDNISNIISLSVLKIGNPHLDLIYKKQKIELKKLIMMHAFNKFSMLLLYNSVAVTTKVLLKKNKKECRAASSAFF